MAIDAHQPNLLRNFFKGTGWLNSAGKPVIGTASESYVLLKKRLEGRNSFQTLLTARLEPMAEGTLIHVNLAAPSWILPFVCVWFSFLAIFGGLVIVLQVASLLNGERGPNIAHDVFPILILLMLMAMGLGITLSGTRSAREEGQFLTDFLIQVLDARPTLKG
jgi:hypothetical protein